MPLINFKKKYKTFAVVAYVIQNTQNMVISGCCFAEDGYEIYKYLKHTCTVTLFCSLLRLSITCGL